jgi:tetratricopeptide (TPR) repeat protein
MRKLAMICRPLLLCALVLAPAVQGPGAESAPAAPPAEDTNALEAVTRTCIQLQEQLHATQLAIERNRKEADLSATENAKVLADRLQTIERALATQRAHELEALQSANRIMLIVAGCFAAIGFVAVLLMAWFQWRTVSHLAELSAALPVARALTAPAPMAALGSGDGHVGGASALDLPNQRLLGALDRLEKRIGQLEQTARPPLQPAAPHGNGATPDSAAEPAAAEPSRAAALLREGQALLDNDDAEGAVARFEEALTLDPANAEALVKKGAALEKLRRLDEAVVCYDRAIAADSGMTIAWLHKGGLFNRMERFSEALECYEKALLTQEKRLA